VPRPDNREVAAVERGRLRLVQSLTDGDDGGVDQPEPERRIIL
jgi:hypothetical protein